MEQIQQTDKQWSQLNPEQKRQRRMNWYLDPTGVTFISKEAQQLYEIRAQRLVDVYNLQEPDRVPVVLHMGNLPLQYTGIDYYTGAYDFEKAVHAFNKFNADFATELENFCSPGMVVPGKAFEILDYRMYSWPGHGLPKNASGYQFREGEYMKANEYDDLIQNPGDFWMRFYIPRIFGSLECLHNVPPLTELVEIPTGNLMPLAHPQVQAMLQNLIVVGQEMQKRAGLFRSLSQSGVASGYPDSVHYLCIAPFDIIGDTLRGTQGIMMDMYRRPDELLEAMEVITKLQIKNTIAHANATQGLVVTFPLHKGADGWMSQSQFEKFYWPSLKKTIAALIEEGLVISLFAEGSYDTRLESVNEFSKGAIHWWFDKTDITRAKKILGNKCSIAGNIPSSLLMKGKPAEVKEYSRTLIKTCGAGGGYILSEGAADVEAKVENLLAMVEAAKEYGRYR
jgi:hypothetical protein